MLLSKRRNMWWNHTNCSLRMSMKGCLFRTFNSYSLNFNGGLCNCHISFCPEQSLSLGGELFLWFLKNDLLRFYCISLLFDSSKCLFWDELDIRTIVNLRPNMTHFNALDFSECRSEEVINFFWRSVYLKASCTRIHNIGYKYQM